MAPRRLRILVVDDVPQICDFFRRTLGQFGATGLELETETDAARALKRVQGEPFDLVISDYRMSGPDGIDILLAARRRNPEGGRVLMTGYGEVVAPMETIRAADVDAYIPKPVDPAELQLLVQAMLYSDAGALATVRAGARAIEAAGEERSR